MEYIVTIVSPLRLKRYQIMFREKSLTSSTLSVCLMAVIFGGLLAGSARPATAAPQEPGQRRVRCGAGSPAGESDLPKPPRPHPTDGTSKQPPGRRGRATKTSPPLPDHLQAPQPQAPAMVPQTGTEPSPLRPTVDRSTVMRGARQFRSLVDQGRVRLLNSDRDHAQIDCLCADGLFQWPVPAGAQLRRDRVLPDPEALDTVEPDAGIDRERTHSAARTARASVMLSGSADRNPLAAGGAVPVRTINTTPATFATEPPVELFRMLVGLASRSTDQKPLEITSLLRPPYKTTRYAMQSPGNPHALGIAVDISAFGGHSIVTSDPEEAVQAVLALLKSLPPGRYRLGLPKAPELARPMDTGVAIPDTLNGDAPKPDIEGDGARRRARSSLPSRGAGRQNAGRLPGGPPATDTDARAARGSSAANAPAVWPFFPPPQKGFDVLGKPVTMFANEHYAAEQYINDSRLRKGLADARSSGVDVYAVFPDGVNHVHVDVKPAP